jgi:hypothetical protein
MEYFSFDDDVKDLAFVFTEDQLVESGAYLDSIANAYICRFQENGDKVKALLPFPCMHPFCPLPQSFTAKVFLTYKPSVPECTLISTAALSFNVTLPRSTTVFLFQRKHELTLINGSCVI